MHLVSWLPLLLVPPAIIFIVWQVRRKDWFAARRRRAYVCLSLAAALLLLAISQPTISIREAALPTVIFVADASPSMRCGQPWAEAARWVRNELPTNTALGVVTFSDRAEVAVAPATALPANLPAVASRPATNIEQALRTAVALAADPSSTALLLYSDGWETEGDALAGAAEARARGLRLFTLAPAKKIPPDAAVVDLRLVRRRGDEPVAVGETVRAAVTVRANCDAPATVKVESSGGKSPAEKSFELKAGQDRTVEFPVRFDAAGYQTVTATVSMAGDVVPENDLWSLGVQVGRRKAILLVGRVEVVGALVALPVDVPLRWITASSLPTDTATLGEYAAVVLNDVPAWEISAPALAALGDYVHDMGGGVVALGGANSFGLGGYTGTALDEMLPVRSEPDDRPPVELVILLDRSASMAEAAGAAGGAAKLDLAKEAVLQIAGVLSAKDRVTVLAFNQQFATLAAGVDKKHWETLQAALGPVRAAGGTLIGPPLGAALEMLAKTPATTADGVKVRRHVIMVTDGEMVTESGATPFDLAATTKRATADGVSVSLVLTSAEGAWPGLGQLATATGGRYYDLSAGLVATGGGNALSRILMEDLPLAVMQKKPAPVAVGERSPIWPEEEKAARLKFEDLPEHLATEAKNRAAVNLMVREAGEKNSAAAKDRPLLATWNYGLGRAVAWPAPWAGPNAKWLSGFAAVDAVERSIEWAVRGPVAEADYDVTVSAAGGRLKAEVRQRRLPEALAAVLAMRLAFSGGAGGGKPLDFDLQPVEPGLWKLEPRTIPAGAYAYALVAGSTGSPQAGTAGESRLVRQGTLGTGPSAEYMHLDNNVGFLERLAAAGGGEMLSSPGEVRRMTVAAARAADLWPYLVTLAGLLVLYDALRGLVGRIKN